MCISEGSRFISLLPVALKSIATLSFTARLSGSPIHLDGVTFNSHPVFHNWLVWVLLDFLMQWLERVDCTKNSVCWWGQNFCIKNGQNLPVILEKRKYPAMRAMCFVFVCVCVYTHTHNTFRTDRLFSDTSNWFIYPLFLTFIPLNHHSHYIHCPALTNLPPANHHKHIFTVLSSHI